MTISFAHIDSILQTEDVEGLIALGAPADEYSCEAKDINAALVKLSDDQLTEANIIAVIALVWAKYFGLSSEDIAKRMQAFQRIAHRLI
jgi:UDP-N-acetylmuramoylalanine-D-glutamate ligase